MIYLTQPGAELHDLDTKTRLIAIKSDATCSTPCNTHCFFLDDSKQCPGGCANTLWLPEAKALEVTLLG